MAQKRKKSTTHRAKKRAAASDVDGPWQRWFAIHAKYDELLRPFVGRSLQPGSPNHGKYLDIMSRRTVELEKFEQEHLAESLIDGPDVLLEAIEQARTTAEMVTVADGQKLHGIPNDVYARLHESALNLYSRGITTVEPPTRQDDPENGLTSLKRWCLIILRGEKTDNSGPWLTVTEVARTCRKSPARISQLCRENKINFHGEGKTRRVDLLSAQQYFGEVTRRMTARQDGKAAGDARRDVRVVEADRRRNPL